MSYPFLVDFNFAAGNLLPGYSLFFPMLNELKAAFEPSHFTDVFTCGLESSTHQKYQLDSINPLFSIQFLHLVQFQSLSFQKDQSNLQLKVPVAKETWICL